MKTKSIIKSLLLAAVVAVAIPGTAQMVSNNNDDEVNKVDQSATKAYRPGEVIVKFKETSRVKMRSNAKGKFATAGVSQVDQVFNLLGVSEADQLMPLTGKQVSRRKMRSYSGDEVKDRDMSGLFRLRMSATAATTVEQAVAELKKLDEVEYAEPNYLVFAMADNSAVYTAEPLYGQQWGPAAINLPQLWDMPLLEGATRPIIAILDTGIDIEHPDLAANIWTNADEASGAEGEDDDNNGFADDVHGWDFINQTAKIADYNGHGTHCAGIAAAVGNNGIGITGANPDAYIMPITVMQSDGTGDVATIIRGIDYATANGAEFLSMSFGGYAYSIAQEQALAKAYSKATLVASAGNNGACIYTYHHQPGPGPCYPAAFTFVLGVEAANEGGIAGFSNWDCDGPIYSMPWSDNNEETLHNYELRAPGVNIYSTYPKGRYKAMNGTSMACPLAAGAISRLMQSKSYEYQVINREILFGDLIHGANQQTGIMDVLAAYNIKDEDRVPTLWLVSTELNDEAEGDGDFRPDAGEIIDLWPTIRNDWGNATNIKLHLEMGDELEDASLIEIITNDVDFGKNLSGYGKAKSDNPIRFKVADNCADNRHIKLKLVITCDNVTEPMVQDFVIVVENGIELGGVVNEDMVLYPNKHYIVTKSIAIPQGKTLTIMPGTRLEFYQDCCIRNEGKLIANGKPDSLIVFTTHNRATSWGGIGTKYNLVYDACNPWSLYTNTDSTLFTLVKTEATPVEFNSFNYYCYVPQGWATGASNEHTVNSGDYIKQYLKEHRPELFDNLSYDNICVNGREYLLSDPEFITYPVLQALAALRDSISFYPTQPSTDYPEQGFFHFMSGSVVGGDGGHMLFYNTSNPGDTISYSIFENMSLTEQGSIFVKDCIFTDPYMSNYKLNYIVLSGYLSGIRNNFYNIWWRLDNNDMNKFGMYYNNFVNCHTCRDYIYYNFSYSSLSHTNYIYSWLTSYRNPDEYMIGRDNGIAIDHAEWPSWLGTGKEEIIRPYIYDSQNPKVDCFTTIDLSNMPTRPIHDTHGIVWKVVVDGYDAQDEFAEMPPLGVGRHKFEVYYNRDDMDTTFTPSLSMGVRPPYTQIGISDGGYWSIKDSVSVYTAFLNITGRLQADGLNRIRVMGGKDYDHFDIPDEYWRFNVLVQAAGSMATGFAAEPGLGSVKLTWNNENNDFEDAMGFNVYRFQLGEENDTINRVRLNETILDIEATEFTDYEVTPGETYYYYYKVLSTDLKEYDISNVVAATPLTSTLGDANASGSVDVADVITTVNYAAGMDPKPFIFGAADVNVDEEIDILDVIGIIKIITHPNSAATASVEAVAEYSVEDGIVYVDCPVDLAGVQLMLTANPEATITATEALSGFEQVGAWMDETSYLFMAYNMAGRVIPAGRHAILNIADAGITDIRLSDKDGHNILAVPAVPTVIDHIAADQQVRRGVYDLMGRKVANDASALPRLQPGIYIVNGSKVVVK